MKIMWLIFALLAALSAGIVVTLSKAGIKNLNPTVAFAIQSVLIVIVSWSAVAFQGKFGELAKIDTRIWIYLIAAGVITTLSSLFTFHALKLGNSSVVSPITNLSLVIIIALGKKA
jgi:transporter family protein